MHFHDREALSDDIHEAEICGHPVLKHVLEVSREIIF
jgi:hypothetical protein